MDNATPRNAYEVLQVRADAHQTVIQAAYRALAGLYHPDTNHEVEAERRMAELNAAYASIRSPDRREMYDRMLKAAAPTARHSRSAAAPPRHRRDPNGGSVLDFGRYLGWSIAELARHDPDYLRWLARHSSGIRYRREISELLDNPKTAGGSRP